jgi:hypothetical protein
MSSANKKAHKAFQKNLKESYQEYCNGSGKLDYIYKDVDGDKVDELIIYPGWGYCQQVIFDYYKGKTVESMSVAQGYFRKYYKKSKVLYAEYGNMGVYFQYYYKMKNGVYKEMAYRMETVPDVDVDKSEYTYYVKGKKVSKSKYNSYIKTLKKGKAGSLDNLKWKQYSN